jgi:muramidase (phage lysozyme)
MISDQMQAFLDAIAACEGTATDDGYRALFGYRPGNGKTFDNGYARHPNVRTSFEQTDGSVNFSTAAGRYQIIYPTYVRLSKLLGTVDFSPQTQDAMACQLIKEDGATADVEAGNLQAAVDKCSGTWASLPASHYPQPKRTYQFALAAFQGAGGSVA